VIIGVHMFGFFGLTAVTTFLAIYLSDTYSLGSPGFTHNGLSPHLVPVLAGAIVLVGGILGNLGGGLWANLLSRKHAGARVLTGGLGFLIAAPCVLIAVGASYVLPHIGLYSSASEATRLTIGVTTFAVFALLGAFFLNVYNGPTSAALLDVVPAPERGSAGGMELTLAHLLGDVYAATVVGALADALKASLGGEQIGLAMLLTVPLALICSGVIGIWGSRYYAPDVAKLGSSAEDLLGTAAGSA